MSVDMQRGVQPLKHPVIGERPRSQLTMLLGSLIGGKSQQSFRTRQCLREHLGLPGKEIMTTSLLDRLTSKGHILEFVGESYRFRQRAQMEEQAASSQ